MRQIYQRLVAQFVWWRIIFVEKKKSIIYSIRENRLWQFLSLRALSLIIVLFGLPVTLLLVKQSQDFRQSAAPNMQMAAQQAQLARLSAQTLRVPTASHEVLLSSAIDHRRAMELLMEEKPSEVIANALTKEEKAKLPSDIQPLVEERVDDLKGEFDTKHSDNFIQHTTEYLYGVKTSDGNVYNLKFADKHPNLLGGARVEITNGVRVGNNIAVAYGQNASGLKANAALYNIPKRTGNWSVAVVLLDVQNASGPKYHPSADTIYNQIYGLNGSSVHTFIEESSYNQLHVTGSQNDIYGWYSVQVNKDSNCGDDAENWVSQVHDQHGDIFNHGYKSIIFAFSGDLPCKKAFGGLGNLPSTDYLGHEVNGERIWVNGMMDDGDIQNGNWMRVISHELGHNLGLQHSSGNPCLTFTPDPNKPGDSCPQEYSDEFDVMGDPYNAATFQYNNYHKERLGWVDGNYAEIRPGDGQTSALLYPIEQNYNAGISPDTTTIKIPVSGGDYYVEFREAINIFDSKNSGKGNQNTGVLIRFVPSGGDGHTYLFDQIPKSTDGQGHLNWYDSALQKNHVYTDMQRGFSILLNDIKETAGLKYADLRISKNPIPCTTQSDGSCLVGPTPSATPYPTTPPNECYQHDGRCARIGHNCSINETPAPYSGCPDESDEESLCCVPKKTSVPTPTPTMGVTCSQTARSPYNECETGRSDYCLDSGKVKLNHNALVTEYTCSDGRMRWDCQDTGPCGTTPQPTPTPTPITTSSGSSTGYCSGYTASKGSSQCYCQPVSVSITNNVCSQAAVTKATVTWNGANCLYCGYTLKWTTVGGDTHSQDYWVPDADCNNKTNEASFFQKLSTTVSDTSGISSVSVMPYKTTQATTASPDSCPTSQN